jgi:hypothetical protein
MASISLAVAVPSPGEAAQLESGYAGASLMLQTHREDSWLGDPYEAVASIEGHLAFYPERVDSIS